MLRGVGGVGKSQPAPTRASPRAQRALVDCGSERRGLSSRLVRPEMAESVGVHVRVP